MKYVWGIALFVGVGLLFAGVSEAKTAHHPVKCRPGYARRTVSVPKRRHGRIVRSFGMIVYTRVRRCAKVIKPKAPSPPVGVATTGTTLLPSPFAPIGSPSPLPPPSPAPPPPEAPANTAAPAIIGTATPGVTLTATTGTWTNTPTSYAYQWQRCDAGGGSCQNLFGATQSNYLVGSADVGSTLRASVTAGNASGSGSATSAAIGPVPPITSRGDPVAVAVGDIASPPGCNPSTNFCQQGATEQLAERQNPNGVLVLGDNQYNSGAFTEYTGSGAYGSTWGFFNPIVHPVPGNHEYVTSGATGYFQYFGSNGVMTNAPAGYYSFNLGSWHIIALNSNCSDSNGCSDALAGGTTSAEMSWLQSDLAANRSACVLAMWHHPLFSSGWTLGTPGVAPLWTALYNSHADVVLNGHDHLYERYAQLDPSGSATTNGIREFVVGTGGESLNGIGSPQPTLPYPQADDRSFGVLVLTLHADSYSWKFITTSGATADSGTTGCHSPGAALASAAAPLLASAARDARLTGTELSFAVRPLSTSLNTATRQGLPVAIHCSRACDVAVTASLRHGRQWQRIASFYETESQIPGPYSQIRLRLPAGRLTGLGVATLVLRFAAVDAAGHRRARTTTVSLRSE